MFQTTNQQNLWNMSLQFGPTWGDVCHVLLRSGPHRQQNAKPQRRDGDVGDINSLGDEQIQWRIAEHAPRPHRSGQVEGKGCLAEFKTWNLAKIGEVQWIIMII